MRNIMDLMKLPAMKTSYIVAGSQGIFNTVKRMDIQEISCPEVNKFLLKHEIMFTTFWNSKDSLERIDLVKAMIKNGCAGIGIMPGPYLNNQIDKEIIDLGNEHSFPIIYIHSDVRWSDIVNQFSLLLDSEKDSMLEFKLVELFKIFYKFNESKNIKLLCDSISEFFDLPIIIKNDSLHFSKNIDKNDISVIMSKLLSTNNVSENINMPITIVSNNNLLVSYYNTNSIFAIYINSKDIDSNNVNNFHKIAPIVLNELDKISRKKNITKNLEIFNNKEILPCRIVLLRKTNVSLLTDKLKKQYYIYEQNDFNDYIIMLIPYKFKNENMQFKEFNKIITDTEADIFVISDMMWSEKEIIQQINMLKYNIVTLLFIKGIYLFEELPLLNLLNYSPLDYKENIFNFYKDDLNINAGLPFFETLRLYLVIRNINNLSSLLNIHPNSVKYRISKCIKSYENSTLTNLNDIPMLKYLTVLELLKLEDNYINKFC